MREIKFRVINKITNKIIGYDYIHPESGRWLHRYEKDNSIGTCFGCCVCDDETLKEQFTGLKDCNGKEIFEGDIIKTPYNETYDFAYYQVVYNVDKAAFWLQCIALHHKKDGFKDISRGGYCEGYLHNEITVEVIGNIFQNPEFIKK